LPEKFREEAGAEDAMVLVVREGVKALIGDEYTVEECKFCFL